MLNDNYFCFLGSAQRNFNNNNNIGKGRLTQRLLAQGLLTPSMVDELHKEWNKVIIFLYYYKLLILFSLKNSMISAQNDLLLSVILYLVIMFMNFTNVGRN